ncbi:MAG: hypothetical protein PVF91_00885 [Chromatiales bacterium]|jgi:hypothetical protein
MGELPVIRTAIPKRRYQVGDYGVTVLGDIDGGDGREYRFIMAFVEQGKREPGLFVCSERNRGTPADGTHSLRVVNSAMSEVLESADRWADLDAFCEQGLEIGRRALGLGSEEAMRLM